MKYVYIAGLEHSGTTLMTYLLSQHPKVIGLGEIASFFSKEHMQQYIAKWGEYPDAMLCSCGKTWGECAFWCDLVKLNGLNSDSSLLKKYRHLIRHIRSTYKGGCIIVDSSKSYLYMRTLLDHCDEIGLNRRDILVVFMVKDVRSFATSIAKKKETDSSLLSHLKTFNWWLGETGKFLNYFEKQEISFDLILYEELCANPKKWVKCIL